MICILHIGSSNFLYFCEHVYVSKLTGLSSFLGDLLLYLTVGGRKSLLYHKNVLSEQQILFSDIKV